LNFADKFDGPLSAEGMSAFGDAQARVDSVSAHAPPGAIIVLDAQLLFKGDFKQSGVDLVLSTDDRELVLQDYFKGEKRAALASPDGAYLTGDIVSALAGHVQLAQADGSPSTATVIGHVTKLVGTATAIRNGVSIILNQGDNVNKGDVVQSGSDSTLGLTFIDGTVFGLGQNAKMVLNEMVYDPNGSNNSSLLSLVQGTISFVAGATAKHGDMKVDTPVATMGIRGTAVLVEIDFDVQGGSAPPAKFQVLVEPDGTTGSYILFDKTTLTPIATVNQAGTQTIISGSGNVSFLSSVQLSPDAQSLINQLFAWKYTNADPNPKSDTHFTDTIIPQTFGLKLADGTIITASPKYVYVPEKVTTSGGAGPGDRLDHIPGQPTVVTTNGVTAERAFVTHSSTIDKVGGTISYADINAGDIPTASAKFSSFSYKDAHNHDVTATLKAEQLAAIKAVEIPLQVEQDPAHINHGTATWTYSIADNAFDFLAAGETLTLTYLARVDNNFAPNNEFTIVPVTITVTGTNDAPTIATSGGTIIERIGTGNTALDTISGTVTFTDVDLTDRPIVSAALSSSHPFKYLDAHGHDITATLTPEQLAAIASVEVQLDVAQTAGNTHNGTATWTYSVPDHAFDFIADDETLVLNYVVQVDDGHGGVVSTPVTVSINGADVSVVGTNDLPTIATTSNAFTELSHTTGSTNPDTVAGTISFTDVDLSDRPAASADVTSFTYQNASHVNVTSSLTVEQLAAIAAVDVPLTVVQAADNTHNGSASWTYSVPDSAFDFLAEGEILTLTYSATVNDGHGGVVTKPITVTVTGTNDTPDITSGPQTGTIAERAGIQNSSAPDTANGTIKFTDADLTDTHKLTITGVIASGIQSGLADHDTQLGWLSLGALTDSTDGVTGSEGWTFSAADQYFDYLADGESVTLTYTVHVDDHHGGFASQNVVVTVNGANDAPVVNAILQRDLSEQTDTAPLSTTIPVTFTDVDLTDVGHTAAITHAVASGATTGLALNEAALIALVTPGTVTKVSGSSSGSVGLTFSAVSTAFDYLAAGEKLTLTYTVAINDHDGGITPQTFTVTITGTNDAPVLAASAPSLLTITEDDTANTGQTVGSFVGLSISDADHSALQGIAITATTSTHGHWEYSTDGSTFTSFPAVTTGAALLLAATDKIKFVPDGQDGGTDTLTYVAWDQTVGTHGTRADVSTSGGSTAFSLASNTATLAVTAINDAPTAAAPVTHYAATEQTPLVISGTGLHVGDVDGNGGTETATLSVGEGVLNVSKGGNVLSITGEGTSSLTLTGTVQYIEALLSGNNAGTITYTANSDNPGASTALALVINDKGNNGLGGAHTATATATIDIAGINDAPVINVDHISVTQHDDEVIFVSGLSVTEFDAAAHETFKITAATADRSSSVSPKSGSGSLAHINAALQTVTYDEGRNEPSTDKVTLTVADGHGATDTVNLIFNLAESTREHESLVGTTGKDVFFGRVGYQDNFVFAANSNHDTILNFTPGEDHIDLSAIVATRDISSWMAHHVAASSTNPAATLVTIDAADTILLKDVSVRSIHASDFIVHP
jgi:VCBS repeat-containing protein